VLLLDASGSMSGLIEQAKLQLWSVVEEFATVRHAGRRPTLRVAVFMYGNNHLPASEGYIHQLVPLTDDLDSVSQALFAITTNGGSEYCGQVIDVATRSLDWAPHPDSYRTIFIAGNEPFTQGPVPFLEAVGKARGGGVIVNTIHCGNEQQGINGRWKDGAVAGGGEFFTVDHDRAVPHIACPQDARLLELNEKLNATYLWYGKNRRALQFNQLAQDENNAEFGESQLADRAAAKASGLYSNRGRCLVDTFVLDAEEDDLAEALAKVPVEALPEAMQAMTPDERVAHVEATAERRQAITKEMQELSAERAEFLAQARREQDVGTLGDAMRSAVARQLQAAGLQRSE
jgi:hypothetical protein